MPAAAGMGARGFGRRGGIDLFCLAGGKIVFGLGGLLLIFGFSDDVLFALETDAAFDVFGLLYISKIFSSTSSN